MSLRSHSVRSTTQSSDLTEWAEPNGDPLRVRKMRSAPRKLAFCRPVRQELCSVYVEDGHPRKETRMIAQNASAARELARPPSRSRSAQRPVLSERVTWILRMLRVHVESDDPRVAQLEAATMDADPLADAFVSFMHERGMREGRALLDQALEHGIASVPNPPRELVDLFAQLDSEPPWLDRQKLALGARAVLRHGTDAMSALSGVLMSGYLTMYATKPLAMTGALTEMAGKRLDATARFTLDVYTSGDMGRMSAGFKTTVRVRVMHALVRRSLLALPRWQVDPWGIPINQRDLVATHLEFTMSYLGATLALGRIDTREEREAVLHLWRYVSYLIGVRDELLPRSFREGLELIAIFNATEDGPDGDSVELAEALARNWLEGPVAQGPYGAFVGHFLIGFCRYFLGQRAADELHLRDSAWKYLAPALALAGLPFELAQLALPRVRSWAQELGKARLVREFSAPTPHGTPTYQPYGLASSRAPAPAR